MVKGEHTWITLSRCAEIFLQEVLLETGSPPTLLSSLLRVKRNGNTPVCPDWNDCWLPTQCWLLGDYCPIAGLSAVLSPKALENCPHTCPGAFWQHPSVPSAESQLIMSLVNFGLSTTCLHNKHNPQAWAWITSSGITAVSRPLMDLTKFPNLHPR